MTRLAPRIGLAWNEDRRCLVWERAMAMPIPFWAEAVDTRAISAGRPDVLISDRGLGGCSEPTLKRSLLHLRAC